MLCFEEGYVSALSNGSDDSVYWQGKLRAGDGLRPAASAFIQLAQYHFNTNQTTHPAIFSDYPDRCRQEVKPDTLFLSLIHLPFAGRHLGPGAPIDDRHLIYTQAQRCPRCIDGRIPSADDRYSPTYLHGFAQRHGTQKVGSRQDAF